MTKRDWTPRKNGEIFCAPACGGRCKLKAYRAAKRLASITAKSMGIGWQGDAMENLGWHTEVSDPSGLIHISKSAHSIGFMTIINGRWVGRGKTAKGSLNAAITEANAELPAIKQMISVIEALPNPAAPSPLESD